MRKSLQIIEKIDHQQSQSDEDLNLIWKTINTIVMNSKIYFEDVKIELENRIQEYKNEITGLLSFDDLKEIIEEIKKNNIDALITEKKCKNLLGDLKNELVNFVQQTNDKKINEILLSYKKLNELIEKEKF